MKNGYDFLVLWASLNRHPGRSFRGGIFKIDESPKKTIRMEIIEGTLQTVKVSAKKFDQTF